MNNPKKARMIGGSLLGICFALLSFKTASADLVIEPRDDFYRENFDECDIMERSFMRNAESGNIVLYESPDTNKVIATIENNTSIFVQFTYTDDEDAVWGLVEYERKTGWASMGGLELIYDNVSFMEEYADEFGTYQGEIDDYQVETAVILWTYPNSGVVSVELEDITDITLSQTYTDPDGYLWGYVAYYRIAEGWICLDAPESKDLTVTKVENQVLFDQPEKVPVSERPFVVGILIVLIAALTAGTALLIKAFWKKKK
ncbi:MAG: hypothetical protein WBI07_14475 [Mobilitalea sp.]